MFSDSFLKGEMFPVFKIPEEKMFKTLFSAATLSLILAAPSYAMDDMKCDDASMMMMQGEMDKMTDAAMKDQKDMAMKEMEMAKTAMIDKKDDECMMHMKKAEEEMMKKAG